jgi:hypothetical protein
LLIAVHRHPSSAVTETLELPPEAENEALPGIIEKLHAALL